MLKLKLKHFSVLLLLAGFYSSADAAVLCSNSSGGVFVRDTVCRAGETQLDPVALGLKGPAGADGADGVSGYEIVETAEDVDPGELKSVFAECPAGKKPVGGGFSVMANPADAAGIRLLRSRPDVIGGIPGWRGVVRNDNAPNLIELTVYAICVTALDETA